MKTLDRSFASQLRQIVSTLAVSQSASRDAKAMRLLQLKKWLIDEEGDDLDVFAETKRAYCGMRLVEIISKQILSEKAERKAGTPFGAIESLVEDEDDDFIKMLNIAFSRDRGFATMRPFHADDRWTTHLSSVNAFTELCLQLDLSGEKNIKGKAYALYRFPPKPRTVKLVQDIQPHLTKRRSRLAFVYVAQRHDPWLFEHPNSTSGMRSLLDKQSRDSRAFQKLFARCAYVQSVIAHGSDIEGEQIASWAGVEADPRTMVDLLAAGDVKIAMASLERHKQDVASRGR